MDEHLSEIVFYPVWEHITASPKYMDLYKYICIFRFHDVYYRRIAERRKIQKQ